MQVKELWKIPAPSTMLAEGGVKLIYPGGNAMLLFDYYDENKNDAVFNTGISFYLTQGIRHSSEAFASTLMNAYDRLVEIIDSEWVAEFKENNRQVAERWDIKHYAIFLKSYGLYEFIASKYIIMETKEGGLD